jgi:hypothetical protein
LPAACWAARACLKRENESMESCMAAGRAGRLVKYAQTIPTMSAPTGIINHSKTFNIGYLAQTLR